MLHPKLIEFLPKSLACRALGPLIPQFAEGAPLSDTQRSAVTRHLALCPDCREEVAAIRDIGALLRQRGPVAIPAVAPSADLWNRIEQSIQTTPQQVSAPIRRPTLNILALGSACAAVIVGAIVFFPQLSQYAALSTPNTASVAPTDSMFKGATQSVPLTDLPEKAVQVATAVQGTYPDSDTAANASAANQPGLAVSRPDGDRAAPRLKSAEEIPPLASAAMAREQAKEAAADYGPAAANGAGAGAVRPDGRDVFAIVPTTPAPSVRAVGAIVAESASMRPLPRSAAPALAEAASGTVAADRLVEKNGMRPANEIEIVSVDASTDFNGASRFSENGSARSPRPSVHPSLQSPVVRAESAPAKNRTIFIVSSETGSGVPQTASEQLNRQQQRRSLFGGYGVATAVILPASSGGGQGNDAPASGRSPW